MIAIEESQITGVMREVREDSGFFENKELVYFSKYPESVFDAQILSLLNYYAEQEWFKEIHLVLGIDVKNFDENVAKAYALSFHFRIRLHHFRLYPHYPIICRESVRDLKRLMKEGLPGFDAETISHVREEGLAWIVSEALKESSMKSKNLVVDIRAANIEETKLYSGSNFLMKRIKIRHKKNTLKCLQKAGHISVVSPTLGSYIKPYRDSSQPVSVISSLAGPHFTYDREKRFAIRKELGLRESDVLFVFSSGGNAQWQNTDFIINALVDKGYKILNLSKSAINRSGVINRFVSYEQMPNYLCAADIAVIWRDDNAVNHVASPVKFSEYLCAGLPVISNNSVRLIRDAIVDLNCGLIIEKFSKIEKAEIETLLSMDRDKIARKAKNIFGIHTISNDYLKAYRQLYIPR